MNPIKLHRTRLKMSQSEYGIHLGKLLGRSAINNEMICRYESGSVQPSKAIRAACSQEATLELLDLLGLPHTEYNINIIKDAIQ